MFGISEIAVIPVRKDPGERSELVTQLLFGDTFYINEEKSAWLFIKSYSDNYEGWVNKDSITFLSEKDFESINKSQKLVTNRLHTKVLFKNKNETVNLPFGSTLPNYNSSNKHFTISDKEYVLVDDYIANTDIEKLSKQFLNSPYLWGGKNPYGIDCSGFSQLIYKSLGINIPRDASQQVKYGKTVNFINDTQTGDLAFFDNQEGIITHVGIILNEKEIIHSSIKVRIDRIDQQGIYNTDLKKYTHKLRLIKRLI